MFFFLFCLVIQTYNLFNFFQNKFILQIAFKNTEIPERCHFQKQTIQTQ